MTAEWATLEQLKAYLHVADSSDDEMLQGALDAAEGRVRRAIREKYRAAPPAPELVRAVLVQAGRWFGRQGTPLGLSGWGDVAMMRVPFDPDVRDMLSPYLDLACA